MPGPILALDLGTYTGFAFCPTAGVIVSGTWDLSPKKGEQAAVRYFRFKLELERYSLDNQGPLEVLYEQVHRHAGTQACHVYGGLLSHLQVWCLERSIYATPVGVGQIKKFWTGSGRATKEEMVAEARLRGFDPVDDNEADALALLHRRIVEGPGGEQDKRKAAKHAYRLGRRTEAEINGRSLARRAARGLRAGDRDLPEDGDEHQKTDSVA